MTQYILRIIWVSIFLLISAYEATAQASPSQTTKDGIAFYQKKNYAQALPLLKKASLDGDADGKYYLGLMYFYGRGVGESKPKGISLYRQAAEAGHMGAANDLGLAYEHGSGGLPKNMERAVQWYRMAAEGGNKYAQRNMGNVYRYGLSVPMSYEKANMWYRKAAEQGNAEAATSLGVSYENGQGVTKDLKTAVSWYLKGAQGGDKYGMSNYAYSRYAGLDGTQSYPEAYKWFFKAARDHKHDRAQYNLGLLYEKGHGVRQSNEKALSWYEKAAAQGYKGAGDKVAALKPKVKQPGAATRQRGMEAYERKKATERVDYSVISNRLNRCIAGIYSRAKSSGWSSIPEPLLLWAIQAEYHLAKNTTDSFKNRDTGPNCMAYQVAGAQAPAHLFSASEPKDFADAVAKIPDFKDGPKILRYMLAEMGKAGHSFADHRLVALLRDDLYKRRDTSAGRKQSELEAYSRMAKRGDGYGFAGLAGHASNEMNWQMTNESEAFAILDNYAIIRPMYERAIDAGYEPARKDLRDIDSQIARAERFISQGRAYKNYQARASMWRKCINPKGLERGTVIECPKHMVPPGMRRVYSYTPWN